MKTQDIEPEVTDDLPLGAARPGPTMVEDPVANFITQHWKNLLIVVAAVVAIFYARAQFIETSNARLGEASGFFSRALDTVIAIGEGTATEEQKKALPDLIRALSESEDPYAELAETVAVAQKIAEGDMAAAEAQLHTPLPAVIDNEESSLKRMAAEVAKLAAARLLLNDAAKRDAALTTLTQLVQEGEFVAGSSLSVLQTVDPSRVEREDLAAKLEARKPYTATLVN